MTVFREPRFATCPRCRAWAAMRPLVFGYPTPELFAAADRGSVALGGCVITGEDPTHQCAACGQDVILDDDSQDAVTCLSCGLSLDGDPEDDATDAGGAICGECNRARNFDALEEQGLFDLDDDN